MEAIGWLHCVQEWMAPSAPVKTTGWQHYVQDWLAPSALSQIAGSSIGAFVAVWLWRQDSRRRDREALAVRAQQRAHSRLVLSLYLARVMQSAEHFRMNCGVVQQNILVRGDAGMPPAAHARHGLITAARAAQIHIPNYLATPEAYVSALDHTETATLFGVMDTIAEIEAALFDPERAPGGAMPVEMGSEDVATLLDKTKKLIELAAGLIGRLREPV